MPSTQIITRRLKSIKSTRKITKAMQLVSASKMRKAQNATLSSRTYAGLAWEMILDLENAAVFNHPLLKINIEATKVGVVIISSNRGQVGSFNTNLIKKLKELEGEETEVITELIVLGKKAREAMTRLRGSIAAEFTKHDALIPISEIYPLAKMLTESYASGQYKKIFIIYNHFVSTLTQKATIKQLLPFSTPAGEPGSSTGFSSGSRVKHGMDAGESLYLFEPTAQLVLEHLLPRIIESQLYQAILESDASEHSARMLMMKNATDAAGDLIDDLTLTFNQLRQNKITTELSEITAGKIALEER